MGDSTKTRRLEASETAFPDPVPNCRPADGPFAQCLNNRLSRGVGEAESIRTHGPNGSGRDRAFPRPHDPGQSDTQDRVRNSQSPMPKSNT